MINTQACEYSNLKLRLKIKAHMKLLENVDDTCTK